MRQDFFEFTPQFKLLIAGNHKPSLKSVDEAIRRRFHLIPFVVPQSFLGADGIDPLTLRPVALNRPASRVVGAGLGPQEIFRRYVEATQPAVATVTRWRSAFQALQEHVGDRRFIRNEAQAWLDSLIDPQGERGAKRSHYTTDNFWRSPANTVYEWAVSKQLIDANPFKGCHIDIPKRKVTREGSFTAAEAHTILTAASA